eukprot:3169359-Amphidinium_carterae.2
MCDCAHRSNATLWQRSVEAVLVDIEYAHGPHHLEPAPWERSLEVVSVDYEPCDCAQRCHAALWQRSYAFMNHCRHKQTGTWMPFQGH